MSQYLGVLVTFSVAVVSWTLHDRPIIAGMLLAIATAVAVSPI